MRHGAAVVIGIVIGVMGQGAARAQDPAAEPADPPAATSAPAQATPAAPATQTSPAPTPAAQTSATPAAAQATPPATPAAQASTPPAPPIKELPMTFSLSSVAFANGTAIPAAHTCDGANASPPLTWSAPPKGTKSLVLIGDDPDAPGKTWVHWVAYNIPPTTTQLPQGTPAQPKLADGTLQGTNDFGKIGYGGPCPPSGTHRYLFKLYALKTTLPLQSGATKHEVEQAIQPHILAQTQLVGTYTRAQ
jgi:Raf kinase inhibitor-like YbhB/YbcL family protein